MLLTGNKKGGTAPDFHAALFGDPVQFPFPDVNVLLLQEDKQKEILRKRVGEFHISLLPVLIWNPKGKDRGHPVRLGFEGIRAKGGGVVFDIEMMEHLQVVVHAGAAEAHGAPFYQGAVDFGGLLQEN